MTTPTAAALPVADLPAHSHPHPAPGPHNHSPGDIPTVPSTEKAPEATVAKEGRTISTATSGTLMEIAGAEGVPTDVAARLRTLAGETGDDGDGDIDFPAVPDDAGGSEGPAAAQNGWNPPSVDPAQLPIAPAASAIPSPGLGDTDSPAFERGLDADTTKQIQDLIATEVRAALIQVLPEVIKATQATTGAIAKTANAVEAGHGELLTKIADLRSELDTGYTTKIAELQEQFTAELDRVKKTAQPPRAAAAEGLVPAEKRFVDSPANGAEPDLAAANELFQRAAAGDVKAQAAIRKVFDGQPRDVAAAAYTSTHTARG